MEEVPISMRPMPRVLPTITPKYPMHVVNSTIRNREVNNTKVSSGITFSSEKENEEEASAAELQVLRSILLRESYLEKLQQVVRTVGRKFKPEVADALDLVRSATVDVIEMIEKWRKVKQDPNAAFIWNGVHYMLKIPSDLDFLNDYLAIQKWMGFPLIRNPFCIPFSMQEDNNHGIFYFNFL
jgi:hypothetical protein